MKKEKQIKSMIDPNDELTKKANQQSIDRVKASVDMQQAYDWFKVRNREIEHHKIIEFTVKYHAKYGIYPDCLKIITFFNQKFST